MTGFGRGQAPLGCGHVTVELRSFNHKYLDLRLHLAPELVELEQEVERRIRERFSRGRLELTARLKGGQSAGINLDRETARAIVLELESLRQELGLEQPLSLDVLTAVPQLFLQGAVFDPQEAEKALITAVEAAISAMNAMRDREAEAISRDFSQRLDTIVNAVDELEKLAETNAPLILERLRKRMKRLLEGEKFQFDENRLTQEAAMIADRSDVTEELIRMRSHVAQFRKIVEETGPVGRRLDFLLQEMSREASTTGAKTQNAEMQHKIVDLRSELTRMREQVQNIE